VNKYKVWTEEVIIKYWEVEAESPEWAEAHVKSLHEYDPTGDMGETVGRVNFQIQTVDEMLELFSFLKEDTNVQD